MTMSLPPGSPVEYTVTGKAEKGPFASGSTIEMQPLDERLTPAGVTYTTVVGDDEGSFRFPSQTLTSPYAQLSAPGHFFNKVERKLSEKS